MADARERLSQQSRRRNRNPIQGNHDSSQLPSYNPVPNAVLPRPAYPLTNSESPVDSNAPSGTGISYLQLHQGQYPPPLNTTGLGGVHNSQHINNADFSASMNPGNHSVTPNGVYDSSPGSNPSPGTAVWSAAPNNFSGQVTPGSTYSTTPNYCAWNNYAEEVHVPDQWAPGTPFQEQYAHLPPAGDGPPMPPQVQGAYDPQNTFALPITYPPYHPHHQLHDGVNQPHFHHEVHPGMAPPQELPVHPAQANPVQSAGETRAPQNHTNSSPNEDDREKRKNKPPEDPDEKRDFYLKRNRDAATKCRHKKGIQDKKTEELRRIVERTNFELRHLLIAEKNTLCDLLGVAIAHVCSEDTCCCADPESRLLLKMWLKDRAKRIQPGAPFDDLLGDPCKNIPGLAEKRALLERNSNNRSEETQADDNDQQIAELEQQGVETGASNNLKTDRKKRSASTVTQEGQGMRKRGRPSKAQLELRAMEKQKEQERAHAEEEGFVHVRSDDAEGEADDEDNSECEGHDEENVDEDGDNDMAEDDDGEDDGDETMRFEA